MESDPVIWNDARRPVRLRNTRIEAESGGAVDVTALVVLEREPNELWMKPYLGPLWSINADAELPVSGPDNDDRAKWERRRTHSRLRCLFRRRIGGLCSSVRAFRSRRSVWTR